MNEIQLNKGERLGSDTRTQDSNTLEDAIERCLHPFCSPVVDERVTMEDIDNIFLKFGCKRIGS